MSTLDEIKRQLSENIKNLESPAPTGLKSEVKTPKAATLVGGAQLVGGLERIAEEEEELRRRKEEKDQAFKAAVEAIEKQFKPDVYTGWNTDYTDRNSSQFSGPSASPQSPDRQRYKHFFDELQNGIGDHPFKTLANFHNF